MPVPCNTGPAHAAAISDALHALLPQPLQHEPSSADIAAATAAAAGSTAPPRQMTKKEAAQVRNCCCMVVILDERS